MSSDKIGVYICQCGGNIGDYVDVNEVVAAVEKEQGVTVAKTAMFTCSDATQTEIIEDAREQGLDGLVIASCSPKLHTFTFRDVAKRAGMNPFQYTQVNVREQCSWTHTDDHEGATEKAVRLVRAGINRTRLTDPLEPIVVETTPKSLVVGGGVAGLRAALGLAEVGLSVFLVEREAKQKEISIVREFQEDLPTILSDPPCLRQVFLNLLNNARQAIAGSGTIRVGTRLGADGSLEVVVRDTGCGIPREHLNKIFDPFFTTKPQGKGTGLGLSICHGIVDRLGGRMSVSSEVGHGATFMVHLPVNPRQRMR